MKPLSLALRNHCHWIGANQDNDSRLTRTLGWATLAVIALCLLAQTYWVLSGDPRPGWITDSILYLSFADFYSGHLNADVAKVLSDFYANTRYPPLFPLSLSAVGAGLGSPWPAYCLTQSYAITAFVLGFIWYRQQTGSVLAASLLLPLGLLSPEFFYLHLEVLSESQFMALLVLVFVLAARFEQGRVSLWTLVAVAGILPLSRTAGLTSIAALTIWLIRSNVRAHLRQRGLAILVMWLPAAAWMIYRHRFPVAFDYVDDLAGALGQGALGWSASIIGKFPDLVRSYSEWFTLTESPLALALTCALLSFALPGWYARIRRMTLDALFLPIYVALVAAWPYPNETTRLLAVSMPVVALCAWEGFVLAAGLLRARLPVRSRIVFATVVQAALCAAASGPRWMDIVTRATDTLDAELQSSMRNMPYFVARPDNARVTAEATTRIVELIKALPDTVPSSECVWTSSYVTTAYLSSFRVAVMQTPKNVTKENARELLGACRYALLVSLSSREFRSEPLYPSDAIGFAAPVLISAYELGGRKVFAGALVDLRP